MTTSGWFLKIYVHVLQISQFLSCDYLYHYTRSYSSLEKNGKGVWGIWTFFNKFFLQRIAIKTRPVYKESFFFRMMIACHQTKRPANSGYPPISSSWDIDPKRNWRFLVYGWLQTTLTMVCSFIHTPLWKGHYKFIYFPNA